MDDASILRTIKRAAKVPQVGVPLQKHIVDSIPEDARFVLIGEASHGTEVR
jgi:erythromycin esterase-like protein